jgi:hypothetical protein
MRYEIKNNPLLSIDGYRNSPGRDTPPGALPESFDQRCLRERRGGRDQRIHNVSQFVGVKP